MKHIDAVKTADVVEVVRCRDCRFSEATDDYQDTYHCHHRAHAKDFLEHSMSFCAKGERDVVEVVRCKDCKHHAEFSSKCNKLHLTPMLPNDFCSYGERREE